MSRIITIISLIKLSLLLAGMSSAQNIEYVNSTLWSGMLDVNVNGDYAYCEFQNGLAILDVSNQGNPTLVSRFYYTGDSPGLMFEPRGEGLDIDGNYAYLADGDDGLVIIDISDSSNPALAGNNEDACGDAVCISGNYAYVVGDSAMTIIDISDPSNPTFAGMLGAENSTDIFVSGNYAYVTGLLDLRIIDVSDSGNPTLVGSYDSGARALSVFVSGSFAFLASWYSGLEIIDVTDPSNPVYAGGYNTPNEAKDIFVVGNYAYVADYYSLLILEISDPSNITLVGSSGGCRPHAVFVSSGYAYLASFYTGLQKIDILDPSNPTFSGNYDAGYWNSDVFVSGDYAYVADGHFGLRILDISDLENPALVGSHGNPDSAQGVFVSGNYAYIAAEEYGLQILNVSNPSNPTFIGRYDTPGTAFQVVVLSNYAYVADGYWGGLQIIDVSDPENPFYVGSYTTSSWVWDVFVVGNYAYVANGDLNIIDVSDPSNPTMTGSYVEDYARAVFVSGNYAYVSFGWYMQWYGIKIIDVSDKSNPTLIGSYEIPIGSVIAVGDYVYAAAGDSGLVVLDTSDPSNPTLIAAYDTPGSGVSIVLEGNYLYLADVFSLMILRFNPQTGIEGMANLPNNTSLSQNFPNPFNASTTIMFNISRSQDVRLAIYDLLGRRVRTLTDEYKQAGTHTISFDASGLSSGVYFYRLQAGDKVDTKRMILLK